jgi:hypothetical protein
MPGEYPLLNSKPDLGPEPTSCLIEKLRLRASSPGTNNDYLDSNRHVCLRILAVRTMDAHTYLHTNSAGTEMHRRPAGEMQLPGISATAGREDLTRDCIRSRGCFLSAARSYLYTRRRLASSVGILWIGCRCFGRGEYTRKQPRQISTMWHKDSGIPWLNATPSRS